MRIVCDSCAAKYQIADEKIAGKLFRVRCKKCSHMIMVDGTQVGGAVAAAAGVGAADAGDAVWYVVIDGAQTGPLSVGELQQQVNAGTIDRDSYAWREGMADWLRLADVPALADQLSGLGAAEEEGGFDEEATKVVDTSAPAPSDPAPADAPAAAALPKAADVGPAPAALAGSGLLAAASNSAQFFATGDSEPANMAAESQARSVDKDKMTAERNESSVLFSLNDLASSKSKTAKASDDIPRTEGSGLIDIRTLASAQAALTPPKASDAGAASPGALSSSAAPATMAPVALPPRKTNTGLYVLLGVVVVLLLVITATLAVVLSKGDEQPVAVAPVEQPEAPAAPEPAEEPEAPEQAEAPAQPETPEPVAVAAGEGSGAGSGEGSAAAAPTEVAMADADAGTEEPAAAPDREERSDRAEREAREEREERQERSEPEPEREERAERSEPTPTPTPEPREERSSDAVAAALAAIQRNDDEPAAQPRQEASPEPEAEAEPERTALSREDVSSTIRRYRSRVSRCSEVGDPGTYRVSFVVQPSGSVTNVSPESPDDVSQCVAGVVRDMTFPRWTGEPLPVTYPFVLR